MAVNGGVLVISSRLAAGHGFQLAEVEADVVVHHPQQGAGQDGRSARCARHRRWPGGRRCRRRSVWASSDSKAAVSVENFFQPLQVGIGGARSAAHSAAWPSSMRRNSSMSSRRLGWPIIPARGRKTRLQRIGHIGAAALAAGAPCPSRPISESLRAGSAGKRRGRPPARAPAAGGRPASASLRGCAAPAWQQRHRIRGTCSLFGIGKTTLIGKTNTF